MCKGEKRMVAGVVPRPEQFDKFLDANNIKNNSDNKNINSAQQEISKSDDTKTKELIGSLVALGAIGISLLVRHKTSVKIKNKAYLEAHQEFKNVGAKQLTQLRILDEQRYKLSEIAKKMELNGCKTNQQRLELCKKQKAAIEANISFEEFQLQLKNNRNTEESLLGTIRFLKNALTECEEKISELETKVRNRKGTVKLTTTNSRENLERISTNINHSS